MFNHQSSSIPQFIERWTQLTKRLSRPDVVCIVGCFLGVILVGVGAFQIAGGGVGGQGQVVEAATTSEEVAPTEQSVVVEVSGAVNKPGVYVLSQGSRIGQALEQAGGPVPEADQQQIAATLNLAQEVTDQQKIYLPFLGENEKSVNTSGSGGKSEESSELTPNKGSGVSVNTASVVELMELEGIGEKRAEDIVAGRPYQSLDELLSKKALTQTLFDKLSMQLTL